MDSQKSLAIALVVAAVLLVLFIVTQDSGEEGENYSKATNAYLKKHSKQPIFAVQDSANGVWRVPISVGVVTTPERVAQRLFPNPVRYNILEPMLPNPTTLDIDSETELTEVNSPVLGASRFDSVLGLDLPPTSADSYSSRAERDLSTTAMADLLTGVRSGFSNPAAYQGLPERGGQFAYRARAGTGHPLEADVRMGQIAFLENEAMVVSPTPAGYAGPTEIEKTCQQGQPCFGQIVLSGGRNGFVAGGGAEWNVADAAREQELINWYNRNQKSSSRTGRESILGAPPMEAATYACRTGIYDAALSSQEDGVREIEECPQRVGNMPVGGSNPTAQRVLQTEEHRRRW